MIIAIVDTETTGLDFQTDKVIEAAVVLIDTESKNIISSYATLLHAESNAAEYINKIPAASLQLEVVKKSNLKIFLEMVRSASVIIAHNSDFDKKMIEKRLADDGMEPLDAIWIDSSEELRFLKDIETCGNGPVRGSRKLIHIAADHGVFMNGAHRALADTLMLTQLVLMIPNLEEQIKNAIKPRKPYYAIVDYSEKHLAKDRGFHWRGDIKRWQKDLAEDELTDLPFEVVAVETEGSQDQ